MRNGKSRTPRRASRQESPVAPPPTGCLTNPVPLRYSGDMLDTNDPEDRQIRVILISAAAVAVLGLLITATVVAVMVSANFNFLNWME